MRAPPKITKTIVRRGARYSRGKLGGERTAHCGGDVPELARGVSGGGSGESGVAGDDRHVRFGRGPCRPQYMRQPARQWERLAGKGGRRINPS